MKVKIIGTFFVLVILLSSVSALTIDYFYSPTCSHCAETTPLIKELVNSFPQHEYHLLDVSQGSYNVQGTPTLKIKTTDCREITLVGSQDIPNYLGCELQEMTTKECSTYSSLEGFNKETKSWFIR